MFNNKDDRWRARQVYRSQDTVVPDGQGRILLPAKRIKELGLSGKVKILGVRTHLEIWNPETLAALEEEYRSQNG